MRVLFLSRLFPNAQQPGREPFQWQQMAALSQQISVRVVAPVEWFPGATRFSSAARLRNEIPVQENWRGLTVDHPRILYVPRSGQILDAFLYAGSLACWSGLRGSDYDAILASWAHPDGVAATLLGRLWRRPVVLQVLGDDLNLLHQRPSLVAQVGWAMRQATAVWGVSRALTQRARELGATCTEFVPRGVDRALFAPQDGVAARSQRRLRQEFRWIVFVGRLDVSKGVGELLNAFQTLARKRSDVALALVGNGPMLGACRQLQSQWPERVVVAGEQPQTSLPGWYAAAQVVAMPSHREGLPNVLREALSCGRPVVASSVGGIPELLRHRHQGRLVPAGSVQELTTALEAQLDLPLDAERIRRDSDLLSWKESAEQMVLALERALAKNERKDLWHRDLATLPLS